MKTSKVFIEITGQLSSISEIKSQLSAYDSIKDLRFGGYLLTYSSLQWAEADLLAAYENLTIEGEEATYIASHGLSYDAATARIIID